MVTLLQSGPVTQACGQSRNGYISEQGLARMLKMSAPPGRHSGNHDRSAKTRRQLAMTQDWQAVNNGRTGRRRPLWNYFTLTLALPGTAPGVVFTLSPSRSASPEAARLGDGIVSNSDLTGLLGQ